MATNYRELTKKAKELGLKYIGVSEENLIKAIAEAENTKASPATIVVTAKEGASVESSDKVKEFKVEDYNTAIVMDGRKEIRRYTVENHGEDFKSMADDFADKRGYVVTLKDEKPALICPHCGGKIYRSK